MEKKGISRLSKKILLIIVIIWLPFLSLEVWYASEKAKKITIDEIVQWNTVAGESVRIALNTMMREGTMDARFDFFDDLKQEISILDEVRVIRSPLVDEVFLQVREETDIPREIEAIEEAKNEIKGLNEQLLHTTDKDEISDLQDEITSQNDYIQEYEDNIKELKTIPLHEASLAKDPLEKQVLITGERAVDIVGDQMRIISPYKVRAKGCTNSSCHVYAKEGEILGAISTRFSIVNVNRQIRENAIIMLVQKLAVGLLVIIIIYLALNKLVVHNILHIRDVLNKMTKGNLAVKVDINTNDEIGDLAISVNQVILQLGGMIRKISALTHTIVNSSEQLHAVAGNITLGSKQQSKTATASSSASRVMIKRSNETVNHVHKVQSSTKSSQQAIQQVKEVIATTGNSMKTIYHAADQSAERIKSLAQLTQKIESLMEVLEGVTTKTSLLALNATIQAAKAGEFGAGFSVVAGELRDLTGNADNAAKKVNESIHTINVSALETLKQIEEEKEIVRKEIYQSNQALYDIKKVISQMQGVAFQTEKLNASGEHQQEQISVISNDINIIAEISKESETGAIEIEKSSKELDQLAHELKKIVDVFSFE